MLHRANVDDIIDDEATAIRETIRAAVLRGTRKPRKKKADQIPEQDRKPNGDAK